MPLEATMLVLDNSEWMRNGDYTPSRWEAQTDAVNVLFNAKTGSNPESMVGLMTMAGKSPEVLVTLTQDVGKILTALHSSKISGAANLSTGINVAQLALKHRQNKNQRQRVIVFVGSPIQEDPESLVKLGKKLKKNNVAVDIVNFGEDGENEEKLGALVGAVDSGGNSHILTVPAGPRLLSDMILSSPILLEEGGGGSGGVGGSGGEGGAAAGDGGFEFGVDPSMDPELAMALRMSLEEEQARQRAAAAAAAAAAATASTVPTDALAASSTTMGVAGEPGSSAPEGRPLAGRGSLVTPGAESITGAEEVVDEEDESEEAMLQQALALSRGDQSDTDMHSDLSNSVTASSDSTQGLLDQDEEMSEEEAIARAIQMSLQDRQTGDFKPS